MQRIHLILALAAMVLGGCDALSSDPPELATYHAEIRRADGGHAVMGAALIRFPSRTVHRIEADNARVLFRGAGEEAWAAVIPYGERTRVAVRVIAVKGKGFEPAVVEQVANERNLLYDPADWVLVAEADGATD